MLIENEKPLDEYYIQALLLAEVMRRILERKADILLDDKPAFNLRPVTEFMKRMRVSTLEKFDNDTYISTVHFYQTPEDLQAKKTLGTLILYIESDFLIILLKKLEYPIDEDNQEEVEDACGTLCNLIAGSFKSGLTQLGYEDLAMSSFSTYRNEVLNGVEYPISQTQKYEIVFKIKGQNRIYLDLVLGSVPTVGEAE